MLAYHDFNYVNYIFEELTFEESINIYLKVLAENRDKRLWDLYIIDLKNGFKGSFENYKKTQISNVKNKNMNHEEAEKIKINTEELRKKMDAARPLKVNISDLK